MRRRVAAFVLALSVLGTLAAGCTKAVEPVTEALSPSPAGPTAEPTGPREIEVVGDAITVETPLPNGDVGSPVSITGTADVVGAELTVRVLDLQGGELAQAIVDASCGDGCVGTFATELYFFVPERMPGWVEVSGVASAGPPPTVRVPVTLSASSG